MKGVKRISSVSEQGNGNITIEFKKGINLDAVRFEIATLIRQTYTSLPEGVSYPSISVNTSGSRSQPVLTYTLNANASPLLIQEFAEKSIEPKLSLINGIGDVNVYGGNPFEWMITYDAQKTFLLDITSYDIASAVNSFFQSDFIGAAPTGQKENSTIRVLLQSTIQDSVAWEKVPVKMVNGRMIFLTDIATVRYQERPPQSYHRINGLNTVNLVIYPEKNSNTLKLGQRVKDKISEINSLLPPGYTIILAYDSTKFIQDELRINGLRSLFSLLILMLFVLLISRKFRYLFLIVISIIANLVIAAIFYYLFRLEIHIYSLAGITVSFGMLINNSIIMIDHIRYRGNRKVFIAILAATLTTIGALCVIFFLKEDQKINLIDFSLVVIINLAISMAIALFLIPALYEKLPLKKKFTKRGHRNRRRVVKISRYYSKYILFGKKFKWVLIILLILGFGIPIHLLPAKIEKDDFWSKTYNKTVGNTWFVENAKPLMEKILGGSLRLFTEYVFESSFYAEPGKTTLYVNGSMPEGCTIDQLNEAIIKMENFIGRFNEVETFQTSIYSPQYASIVIQFKDEFEFTGFPYFLKEELTSRAISLGGLDWGVYGVGQGFSNALNSGYKSENIILKGYNYDQLYSYADQLKQNLLKNPRVKEVDITGSTDWQSSSRYEYYLSFIPENFALYDITPEQFYFFLSNKLYSTNLNQIFNGGKMQFVSLTSSETGKFNVWDLKNEPIQLGERMNKISSFGNIQKKASGNNIFKEDQQYQLVVAYDFIGPGPLAKIVQDEQIEKMSKQLPLGYKIYENQWWGWDKKDKQQYFLILLVIAIIFLVCSILLESIVQPLAILMLIPISFIGVFLTFYLFNFNFDQGGFASFILLSGIVVNSGLFIINDYNQLIINHHKTKLNSYVNAFNYKIIPILLTILSTMLGLVPFIWNGQKEVFWFSFAVGTIGGLVFSLIALLFYLPLFFNLKESTMLKG
jgi:multidrug efflux pump subunit AcrB